MGRTKEVDPNAPLQFVAFEFRFPTIRRALSEAFSSKAALKICDRLRELVREIFEKTITERLRKEVLRKEPAHVAC